MYRADWVQSAFVRVPPRLGALVKRVGATRGTQGTLTKDDRWRFHWRFFHLLRVWAGYTAKGPLYIWVDKSRPLADKWRPFFFCVTIVPRFHGFLALLSHGGGESSRTQRAQRTQCTKKFEKVRFF